MSVRITVLLEDEVEAEFTAFCHARGFKKSTLAARLIREHLAQETLPLDRGATSAKRPASATKKRGSVQ